MRTIETVAYASAGGPEDVGMEPAEWNRLDAAAGRPDGQRPSKSTPVRKENN